MEFDDDFGGDKKKGIDRRRETSRYAARDRRGKEADIFADLKDVVPVVEESTVTHVDRIALLRVAATLCRMRKHAGPFFNTELVVDENAKVWNELTMSECLDGFVIMADSDGTILYITESVSIFLGLTQTDLIGRQIKEFIHATDYDDFMRLCALEASAVENQNPNGNNANKNGALADGHRMIMRMKTVISPRGRNLNLKSALFKAIVCRCRVLQFESGRVTLIQASTVPAGQGNNIGVGAGTVKSSETTSGSFMTRHTCDMRFSYVSENFNYLLRHESRSLMGTSFYDLVHPADLETVADSIRELFRKGHCRSMYYRLLAANGAVAWVQTEATTVSHTTRGQKGQYVLCVHSLIGMQSDLDSWTTAAATNVVGAAQPACTFIKTEIEDVAEYFGRQPQFIDCHDFTPLIEPDAIGINMSDYRPTSMRQSSAQSGINPPRRKDSYNEVFEWLFRDQPGSPFNDAAPLCGADGGKPGNSGSVADIRNPYGNNNGGANFFREGGSSRGFGNQPSQQLLESQSARNNGGIRRLSAEAGLRRPRAWTQGQGCGSTVRVDGSAVSNNRASSNDLYDAKEPVFRRPRGPVAYGARSASIGARNGALAAAALDDVHRVAGGAAVPARFAGSMDANSAAASFRTNSAGPVGRRCGPGEQPAPLQLRATGGAAPPSGLGCSPLEAGFAEFGMESPDTAVVCSPGPGCGGFGNPSAAPSAPYGHGNGFNRGGPGVSALPASDGYAMSNGGLYGSQGPRNDAYPAMQSSVSPAGHKRHLYGDSETAIMAGCGGNGVNVNQLPVAEAPQQISREFFEEFKQQNPHLFPDEEQKQQYQFEGDMCNNMQGSSDALEHLAPFVPMDDMLQLNSEPFPMDVSFPELNFAEYSCDTSFGAGLSSNAPMNQMYRQQQAPMKQQQQCNYNPYGAGAPNAKRARLNESESGGNGAVDISSLDCFLHSDCY
uniref:PAS domain-containing protein n=1 Tax=Panagrellus redivivus TaxID=6233 RepID=A0A7E4VNY8_PANRE